MRSVISRAFRFVYRLSAGLLYILLSIPVGVAIKEFGSMDEAMAVISAFYGMIIKIYNSDHNPPHFHVEYGDQEIWVEIKSGKILRGSFPVRLKRDVEQWRRLHKNELLLAWDEGQALKKPRKIRPLE